MNEFDDLDQELAAAFAQRPSTLSRPSLRDVRQRARRRQRQRQAGVLSACAVVGIGGVAVIATRSPGNRTTIGVGDSQPTNCGPTTKATVLVSDTSTTAFNTVPQTTITFAGTYVLQPGDYPGLVAEKFNVTVAELDAVNRDVPGYGGFLVGTVILIPGPGTPVTTSPVVESEVAGSYTIAEGDYPGKVAEMFGVTVAELDAVNEGVPGYGGFLVGTVIRIPFSTTGTTLPTMFPDTTTTTNTFTGDASTSSSLPECEPTVSTIVLTPNETQPVLVAGQPLPVFDSSTVDSAIGIQAPQLSGYNFNGSHVVIDPVTQGPYLLVFLAHWCPHCNAQIPLLNDWRNSGAIPAELNVVGISTAAHTSSPNYPPSEWIANSGWTWPVMADESRGEGEAGVAAEAYGTSGYPFFVLIGADGLVKARFAGELSIVDLEALIDSAPLVESTTTIARFLLPVSVVQVANCSQRENSARPMSEALAAEGFTTAFAEPEGCTIHLTNTKILYNPDDPYALMVASSLSLLLGDAVVEASDPQVPTIAGSWGEGVGVIVLLGDDLAGKTLADIHADLSATSTTEWPTTTAS